MALGRRVAVFNRHVTNRVLGPVAGRLPGFGIVVHTGRRSGRSYRTPVNVFRTDQGYVIALTYGPDADWVRNVIAAGGCELELRGRAVRLTEPRLLHDERRGQVPWLPRRMLTIAGVSDFLDLTDPSR